MRASALNTTAYRIFKILEWLQQKPLSVEELNQRFLEDPLIGRSLSEDSIWLYINTLREVGCEISRPIPTNGYRYELISHPFGIFLAPKNLQALVKAKTLAEEHFEYQQVLHLDSFIRKVLNHASLQEGEEIVQEIFAQSRSVDYNDEHQKIETLNETILQHQLLYLTYDSPMSGNRSFYFLPLEITYKQGVLYLVGHGPDKEETMLLRVERITSFEPVNEPEISEELSHRFDAKTKVVLRFPGLHPQGFEPLGMGDEVQYFQESGQDFLEVTLKTNDFFILKQKLLQMSRPFTVVEPISLRESLVGTLEAMKGLYI